MARAGLKHQRRPSTCHAAATTSTVPGHDLELRPAPCGYYCRTARALRSVVATIQTGWAAYYVGR